MALIGLGMGPMLSGLTVAIQTAVPPRFIGTAGANLTFFRQIGGSVAPAVAGTAYTPVVTREAPVHGLAEACAAATATVIPWLGGVGAAVALLALAPLPRGGVRLGRAAPRRGPRRGVRTQLNDALGGVSDGARGTPGTVELISSVRGSRSGS